MEYDLENYDIVLFTNAKDLAHCENEVGFYAYFYEPRQIPTHGTILGVHPDHSNILVVSTERYIEPKIIPGKFVENRYEATITYTRTNDTKTVWGINPYIGLDAFMDGAHCRVIDTLTGDLIQEVSV